MIATNEACGFDGITNGSGDLIQIWFDEVVFGSGGEELVGVASCAEVRLRAREAEGGGDG